MAQGDHGLLAFHWFLLYLVKEHNVNSVLFEGKINCLIKAIQAMSCTTFTVPQQPSSQPTTPPAIVSTPGDAPIIPIDINASPTTQSVPRAPQSLKKLASCPGIIVDMPPRKSTLTAYPFALHKKLSNPWDISLSGGPLILCAWDCCHIASICDSKCVECLKLSKNSTLEGILDHISNGINENSPFYFHGSGGMIEIMQRKTGQV